MITTVEKRENVLDLRRSTDKKKKAPRMTITLGMRLKDGIVLAADRLLSTEHHQFEEDKITFWPLNHGEVFFAFADSPVAAKEVRQKIENRLETKDSVENGISLQQIQEICESVINEIYANRLGSMPLQMLIVARVIGEGMQMWFYDGQAGFNLAGEFEILGAGESSLIRYLKAAYSHKDSVQVGKNLAIYLVHEAGEFIPGCKGIDVVVISKTQSWDWLDKDEVAAKIKAMREREREQLRQIIMG